MKRLLKWFNFRQKGRDDVLWFLASATASADRWLAEYPEAAATARWLLRDMKWRCGDDGLDYDPSGHMSIDSFRDLLRQGRADDYKG